MTRPTPFELLGFDHALEKLRFDRHINLGGVDLSDFRIAYCPGDFHFTTRIELREWMQEHKIAGVVVDGDATIDASLGDDSVDEPSAFLLARGNLRAKSITLGGAEAVVFGDVEAEGAVFNARGRGRFDIFGSLRASHLVTCDHATVVSGATPARSWALGYIEDSMRGKVTEIGSYRDILAPQAASEFFVKDDDAKDPCAAVPLIRAIRAGRPILRH